MRRHVLIVILFAAAALAVAIGALFLLTRPRGPAAAARAFAWPPGLRLTYDLTLEARDRVSLAPGAAAGGAREALATATRLRGRLELASYGAGAGATTLGVRLDLDEASVIAADVESLGTAERAALARTEALVAVRPDGTVTGLRFPAGTPEPVQNVLMLAVTETAVTLGPGLRWEAAERNLQGTAESRYAVVTGAAPLTLDRTRARYRQLTAERAGGGELAQTIRGTARAVVDEGVVARLDASEKVALGGEKRGLAIDHELTASLVLRHRARAAPAGPPAAETARAPGELAVRPDFEARQLAHRVDGLTAEALEATVLEAGVTGHAPDHNRFLWRATGLLRQRPELCANLVELYDSDRLQVDGRALVLDLLVGAGTPAAQEALRDALSRPRGRGEEGYAMLYQRLGLVQEPDAGSLDFARTHARGPGPEGRAAALASYGAVAGKRLRAGDAEAGKDVDALVAGLRGADAAAAKVDHIVALANARLASVEPLLAGYAAAPEQPVRRAAARALHGQRGDAARRALLGLAGDADGEVQRQALIGLAGRALAAGDLGALAAVVDRGGMHEPGYDALLDVVANDLDRREARAVVEAVLRQDVQNARVLGRARQMLEARR